MDQIMIDNINATIATLRGECRFREAIEITRISSPKISEDDGKVAILLNGFNAAVEGQDLVAAREFAEEVQRLEPGVPTVCEFLGIRPPDMPDEEAE